MCARIPIHSCSSMHSKGAALCVGVALACGVVAHVSASAQGLQFIPLATPCRVADTQFGSGQFGPPELSAGSTRNFNIPQSACDIPSTAAAYSLNVTVVPNAGLGFLTIWPTGETQPLVSTLNSYDGRVKANAAIVPAGTSGGVSVFADSATQLILDINGYFVPQGTTGGLAFTTVPRCRIVDTRTANGPLGGPFIAARTSRAFPIPSSSCNIPSTAVAYSLNVTALPHATLGYLTAWPTGQTQPLVSTLNAYTGTVTANAAVVKAGTNGEVSVFVTDDSDILLDINGYFAPAGSITGPTYFYPVTPCRATDTRTVFPPPGPYPFPGRNILAVETSPCAPPSTASAYVLNATLIPYGAFGYLELWPITFSPQPDTSTLNAYDGAITSNMAIVETDNGDIYGDGDGPGNIILDLFGYFAP
jgi:hypothetical protein